MSKRFECLRFQSASEKSRRSQDLPKASFDLVSEPTTCFRDYQALQFAQRYFGDVKALPGLRRALTEFTIQSPSQMSALIRRLQGAVRSTPGGQTRSPWADARPGGARRPETPSAGRRAGPDPARSPPCPRGPADQPRAGRGRAAPQKPVAPQSASSRVRPAPPSVPAPAARTSAPQSAPA